MAAAMLCSHGALQALHSCFEPLRFFSAESRLWSQVWQSVSGMMAAAKLCLR